MPFQLRIRTPLLCILLLHSLIIKSQAAFASSSNSIRKIAFDGNAEASIRIKQDHEEAKQLQNFLMSQRSHHLLLGSDNVRRRRDGTYESVMESVSFFGYEIEPSFINRISHNPARETNNPVPNSDLVLKVSIEDSTVRLSHNSQKGSTLGSRVGKVMEMMERCSFKGGNEMRLCQDPGVENEWILSSHLSVEVIIPLRSSVRFLPPGFQKIGSSIIGKSCKKGAHDTLIKLSKEYQLERTKGTVAIETVAIDKALSIGRSTSHLIEIK